jgi:hypothetical protein
MAALVGVAPNLRAVLATHVSLQFVDRGRLRPADDVQRHGLMGVAPEAADLKIEIPCVQSVAEAGRGLSRSFESDMRWFQATHARRSASFRASAARSAECRTELP